jgi:hypothetical protein
MPSREAGKACLRVEGLLDIEAYKGRSRVVGSYG